MSNTPTSRKILVANRGEIAVRVIHTRQELGMRTVAVLTCNGNPSLSQRSQR